jgi:outer membrane protein
MKKTLLSVAAGALVLSACQQPAPPAQPVQVGEGMKIAYVNTDSLLNGYEYAKKVSDQLNDKAESARADFNQKARILQQDEAEFQRKVQNNAFLSQERAQKEYEKLQRSGQELQEMNQKLSAELMQEQSKLTAELRDTIISFLNSYGKDKYSLILSNNMGDNVLYSAPGVDITGEVIDALNKRYAVAQKK